MRSLDPAMYSSGVSGNKGSSARGSDSPMDDPAITDLMDYYLVRKSESYKFIRMADDLHDVANYMSEIRICFLMLTGTFYLILLIYLFLKCLRRGRRQVNAPVHHRQRTRGWDAQGDEYQASGLPGGGGGPGQTDDLVSVRSDGAVPGKQQHLPGGLGPGSTPTYMGGRAGNARQAPQFMRHGQMQNHSSALGHGGHGSGGHIGPGQRLVATAADAEGPVLLTSAVPSSADRAQAPLKTPVTPLQHHHGPHMHTHTHLTPVASREDMSGGGGSIGGGGATPGSSGGSTSSQLPPPPQPQQQTQRQSPSVLNNIVEEKEETASTSSGKHSPMPTSALQTFGIRHAGRRSGGGDGTTPLLGRHMTQAVEHQHVQASANGGATDM